MNSTALHLSGNGEYLTEICIEVHVIIKAKVLNQITIAWVKKVLGDNIYEEKYQSINSNKPELSEIACVDDILVIIWKNFFLTPLKNDQTLCTLSLTFRQFITFAPGFPTNFSHKISMISLSGSNLMRITVEDKATKKNMTTLTRQDANM